MIHRVILGALERFIGVLIEHYAGAFPVWLAPVQASILTVTEQEHRHGEKVLALLKEAGIRAEGDFRNEKLSLKSERRSSRNPVHADCRRPGSGGGWHHAEVAKRENLPFMKPMELIERINQDSNKGVGL